MVYSFFDSTVKVYELIDVLKDADQHATVKFLIGDMAVATVQLVTEGEDGVALSGFLEQSDGDAWVEAHRKPNFWLAHEAQKTNRDDAQCDTFGCCSNNCDIHIKHKGATNDCKERKDV